jgi:hypothetical protein
MNVTLGRAINLLNSGFSVMPISEGKKPLILWKEYQTKKIEKSELEKLEAKTKGYGIITGYYNVEVSLCPLYLIILMTLIESLLYIRL